MSRGYQAGTSANPFDELQDDDQVYGNLQRDATAAVRQFSQNTTTLTKLVGSVGKSEASGKSELRDRIHVLINDNKKIAKDTNALLKRMNSLKSPDAREQATRRAAQQRLAQDFQTWMSKFQEIATLDLNKERKDVQQSQQHHAPSPQKGSGSFPGLGKGYDSGGEQWDERTAVAKYEQQKQQQLEQEDDDFNQQIVAERNREIREIETAVVEVGQIFQDLAAMVNEQGVMVDNIEANISSSVEATTTGVVQLEGAEEYQIKARKKCICITVIVVVIVAVLVVVILFALKVI